MKILVRMGIAGHRGRLEEISIMRGETKEKMLFTSIYSRNLALLDSEFSFMKWVFDIASRKKEVFILEVP